MFVSFRYSKTCVKRPLKNRHYKDVNNNWSSRTHYCLQLHAQSVEVKKGIDQNLSKTSPLIPSNQTSEVQCGTTVKPV